MNSVTDDVWHFAQYNLPGNTWANLGMFLFAVLWLRRWWPMPSKWHKERGHKWYWPADKLLLLATWPLRALWRWWHKTPSKFQQLEAILSSPEIPDNSRKPTPTVFADAKGYADSANAPDRVGRDELDKACEYYARATLRAFEVQVAGVRAGIEARLSALEAKEAKPATRTVDWGLMAPVDAIDGGAIENALRGAGVFEPIGTHPIAGDIVYDPGRKRYYMVESVSDEVYLDSGGNYHCWAFSSPAVVPDSQFGGEARPRVVRRCPPTGGFTEAQWNQATKDTPPAPTVPEVRVFRDPAGIGYICVGGVEVAVRCGDTYSTPNLPWETTRFLNNGCFSELHGPEKDAIVAGWRAWRGKQK